MERSMMECIPSLSIILYTLQFGRIEKIALFRYEIPKQWHDIFIPFRSAPFHFVSLHSVPFVLAYPNIALAKYDRTAFKRLSVNLESKVGCLYFFENRSLTTDLVPTKEDSKTLCNKNNKKYISYCYCNSNFLQISAKLDKKNAKQEQFHEEKII